MVALFDNNEWKEISSKKGDLAVLAVKFAPDIGHFYRFRKLFFALNGGT